MALFEFELRDSADISPWNREGELSLSWFALTDGWFRMPVGDQVLFEYSEELQRHLKLADSRPDYQIASFANDMLQCVLPATAPVPPRIERLVENWDQLRAFEAACFDLDEEDDPERLAYVAWRWLGERSPWTSYLTANPRISFVRVGDEVRIYWDNRGLEIEGIVAWTAHRGMHALSADGFVEESRNFSNRLLAQMASRIDRLETGALRTQVPVDPAALRQQHKEWLTGFDRDFTNCWKPDFSWEETERALCALAPKCGIGF